MIQGIQSNTYSTSNVVADDSIKKTSTTEVEQEINKSQVSKTDTVVISTEGRLANENEVQSVESAVASTQPSSGSTLFESTEITETSTVLTNLTEAQLNDLVEKGTITQAEKNAEIARRASLEADEPSEEVNNDLNSKSNVNLLDENTY